MTRSVQTTALIFIFREGPVPPDSEYLRELLESYSPDSLEGKTELIGVPMFPWPNNIEEASLAKLGTLQGSDQILKGSLTESEDALLNDTEGNRVYILKGMMPLPDTTQDALIRLPDVEKLMKEGNVRGLIKSLNYRSDPSVRKKAAKILGQLGELQALEPLIATLEDDDSSVCVTAIRALEEIGWAKCIRYCDPPIDQFLSLLEAERRAFVEDPERQKAIILTLGQIVALIEDFPPRERAIKSLFAILKHGFYRSVAIEALGQVAQQTKDMMLRARIIESLDKTLDDVDERIRETATIVLEKIGEPVKKTNALELLRQQLLSNDYYVREAAHKQAQSLTGRAKYPLLEQAYQANIRLQEALEKQGWGDVSIDLCQESIRLEPGFSAAYVVLSYLYRYYSKKYDISLKWVQKSVEIDPQNVQGWNELGLVHVERGNVVAATKAFLMVIALEPGVSDVEPYLRLVDVFMKLGMREQAFHARERIANAGVGLDPNEAERWSHMIIRADIEKLREAAMASLKQKN